MTTTISLDADGELELRLPSGRSLHIPCTVGGLGYIKKILRDAAEPEPVPHDGYIAEYPTQHVIDIWKKQDRAQKAEVAKEKRKQKEEELGFKYDELKISL